MSRIDDSDTVVKCWLPSDEIDRLEQTAGSEGWEREITIQLMGRCELRVSEVSYPSTRLQIIDTKPTDPEVEFTTRHAGIRGR